jgi:hypothetical protein
MERSARFDHAQNGAAMRGGGSAQKPVFLWGGGGLSSYNDFPANFFCSHLDILNKPEVEGGVEALLPLEERLEDIAAASVLTELGPVVQVALVCLHRIISIIWTVTNRILNDSSAGHGKVRVAQTNL